MKLDFPVSGSPATNSCFASAFIASKPAEIAAPVTPKHGRFSGRRILMRNRQPRGKKRTDRHRRGQRSICRPGSDPRTAHAAKALFVRTFYIMFDAVSSVGFALQPIHLADNEI